jgi:hypothetical protein
VKRAAFARAAGEMWDEIPPETRQGIEAVTVVTEALPHPEFADVFTLGECVTEVWPGSFGEGEASSELVLYYGSFVELAHSDPEFDWADELWETILHELLHHREAAAGESALDDLDWAEEQNRLRLSREPFDPAFYRAVAGDADGVVRLDSQIFIEVEIPETSHEARFEWRGSAYVVQVPEEVAIAFIEVENLAGGRLCLVVRRARPWWRLGRAASAGPVSADLRRMALPQPVRV